MNNATLEHIDSIVTCLTRLQSDGSRVTGIKYSQQTEQIMREQKARGKKSNFITEWKNILRMGRNDPFIFNCDTDESSYITLPRDAVYIQTAIASALLGTPCSLFIDAFGCVGGDTIAAMHQFRQAQIFTVQRNVPEENGRYARLVENIAAFESHMPDRTSGVQVYANDIKTFINSTLTPAQDVSVLYLDPPWALGADARIYSHPVVINNFLTQNVWQPLLKKHINPLLIVFKLPGNPTSPLIENWPMLQNVYRQIAYLTPSNKFAVYILRRADTTV